jgi:hypothetical protein
MNANHLTEKDFLAYLYGLEPEPPHLAECPECSGRWQGYLRRRQEMLSATVEVPERFLRAQRLAIHDRIRRPSRRFHLAPLPSMAALLLLLSVLSFFRAGPQADPAATLTATRSSVDTVADSELYQDVYSLASSATPLALEPMSSLFEVQQ